MSVSDAVDHLADEYRSYSWFTTVGIANDELVLYVNSRPRTLADFIESKPYCGFKVTVKKMGKVRPL